MRNKLRIFFTALYACICTGQGSAQPTVRRLMELPPFERAVLIIKHHVVQPGEPYKKGVRLTEQQADALLRKDLRKFCALYRSYGADSLLLACLSYNCGPASILGGNGYKKSRLLRKLEAGDRNIMADYLSFCHYKGKHHPGIWRRRWIEYHLLYSGL